MDNNKQQIDEKDLSKNWVSSSRFLFYVTVFCLLAFVVGCSAQLFTHRWKGIGEPTVPDSTKYNPTYKAATK
jgi:hypothetical protein